MWRKKQQSLVLALAMILLVGCVPESSWLIVNSFTQTSLDFKHYPTAQTVTRHLEALPQRFPQLVQYEVVGESVQGRPIAALTITNLQSGPAETKPALLVLAQQHAREPIGSQLALAWVENLLTSFGNNEIVTHLLNTRTVYVMPQINPDGNDIFLSDDQNLRSNLQPSDLDLDGKFDEDPRLGLGIDSYYRQLVYLKGGWVAGGAPFREGWNTSQDRKLQNAHFMHNFGWVDSAGKAIRQVDKDGDGKAAEDYYHGVDINRNWDIAWLEGDARVTSYTYKGVAPWSEPETRAIRDFTLARPNIVTVLDIHSGVNMILYPWSMTSERPIDEEILQELARAGSAIAGAPHTMSGDGLYLGYGTAKDWFYSLGMVALTAEVYGASSVVSYHRIWPAHLYIVHTSTAHRFNPPPQKIMENNEKWQPYLTYVLSTIPSFVITDIAAVDETKAQVTLTNTGHLTPNFVRAWAQDKELELTFDASAYSLAVDLHEGEAVEIKLELGSVLQIAERPLPPVTYLLTRTGDTITVEGGNTYSGASPASLFPFGYVAPSDPWGQEQWFITKGETP